MQMHGSLPAAASLGAHRHRPTADARSHCRTAGAATTPALKSKEKECWSWGRAWAWPAWRSPCWAQVRGWVGRRGGGELPSGVEQCKCASTGAAASLSSLASPLSTAEVAFTDIGDVLPLLQRNVSENISPAALKLRGAATAAAEVGARAGGALFGWGAGGLPCTSYRAQRATQR